MTAALKARPLTLSVSANTSAGSIRKIPGLPKSRAEYFATSSGDILRLNKTTGELVLKSTRIQNSGYKYVSLSSGKRSVHRLVCAAFHGEPPAHYECRHLNQIKTDNRASNLRWGSKAQNESDKIGMGQTKLDPERVTQIRQKLIEGASVTELSLEYGVSYHSIYYISLGVTWTGHNCGDDASFRRWRSERPVRLVRGVMF